jgi:radical SAM protein with 4Fe4S-binding SPASM domain
MNENTFCLSAPFIAGLILTNRCNLYCKHCINNAHTGEIDMDIDFVYKLIDECRQIGVRYLDLNGGECFLHPHFHEIFQYIIDCKLKIILTTNGTLLPGEWLHQNRGKLFLIRISLDSHDPRIHDGFRGQEGAFRKTTATIRRAKEAGHSVTVLTTISRENKDELRKLIALLEELGADALHTIFLAPAGRGSGLKDSVLDCYEAHDFLVESEVIRQEMRNRGSRLKLLEEAPQSFLVKEHIPDNRIAKCGAAFSQIVVTHTGYVLPCGGFLGHIAEFEKDEFNVRKQSLQEIYLHSPTFQQIRNTALFKGRCSYCEYLAGCGGGCRLIAWLYSGGKSFMEEDPMCWHQPLKSNVK